MRATFCGVRGSTPAPGADFVRVGGHTSCVAISPSPDPADPAGAADSGDDVRPPTLLLDAGTGIRRVPALLGNRPFQGTILLTHLHWDHVQGIPFFPAGDRDDARVRLVMPAQGDPAEVLSGAMSPPHFPIGPEGLRGAWVFEGLEPGCHQVEGFDVLAAEIPHKGGRTYGYRVTDPAGRSLAYMPDHGPLGQGPGPDGLGARHAAAGALADGVDVLIHGAQFTAAEAPMAEAFGHATVDYAMALATEAGVGRLVLFHHSPVRTDDQIDAIAAALADAPVPVTVAREALTLYL